MKEGMPVGGRQRGADFCEGGGITTGEKTKIRLGGVEIGRWNKREWKYWSDGAQPPEDNSGICTRSSDYRNGLNLSP